MSDSPGKSGSPVNISENKQPIAQTSTALDITTKINNNNVTHVAMTVYTIHARVQFEYKKYGMMSIPAIIGVPY